MWKEAKLVKIIDASFSEGNYLDTLDTILIKHRKKIREILILTLHSVFFNGFSDYIGKHIDIDGFMQKLEYIPV